MVLAFEQIERQVDDRARIASLGESTRHQQLKVGRLADLPRHAQHVDGGLGQVDRVNELRGQAHAAYFGI